MKKTPAAKEPASADKAPAGSAAPDEGAAALERVRPALASLKPGEILPLTMNLQRAASAVLGVLDHVERRSLRPRLEKLAGIGEFDLKALTDLPDLARAAYYLRNRHGQLTATASDAALPAGLADAAQQVRARMLKAAEYGLDDDEAARQIAFIRRGSGYRDLADDLMSLAALYLRHKDDLSDSGRHYRAEDAKEATEQAAEILRRLGEHALKAGGAEAADLSGLLARCGTRLLQAYDKVAAAGRYLCRDERDVNERFPNLYFMGRGQPTKKKQTDADAPTPTPAPTPAPAPARNKR